MHDSLSRNLQRVIYIFFYLFGKQNGACNLLHGEVILKGLNRKHTEFIAVQDISNYCAYAFICGISMFVDLFGSKPKTPRKLLLMLAPSQNNQDSEFPEVEISTE
ncbi:hypothetical protein NQ315_013937 [Exocentrus adspersus]|uniref:Uncharacterized protein n=1 Tax=Exocentrus adspersus TaxID=1586481 RepID=A0AAV8VR58_9CUCU|nr:hypothetical protein NQ315_013937 [Exocentrus adspersus]